MKCDQFQNANDLRRVRWFSEPRDIPFSLSLSDSVCRLLLPPDPYDYGPTHNTQLCARTLPPVRLPETVVFNGKIPRPSDSTASSALELLQLESRSLNRASRHRRRHQVCRHPATPRRFWKHLADWRENRHRRRSVSRRTGGRGDRLILKVVSFPL